MKLWMNVGGAAEYAGVCRDTIYTAVERGELRHVRIGGRRCIRLRAPWIDEWLEHHTREAHVRRVPSTTPGTGTSAPV